MSNSNMLLVIFGVIVIVGIIYYINQNNEQPIPNNGTIDVGRSALNYQQNKTNGIKNIPQNRPSMNVNKVQSVSACDPMTSDYSDFIDYEQKRLGKIKKFDLPYDDEDPRDFIFKKKKFTKRTPDDLKDLYDVNKMLPQEIEMNWFDAEPLLSTKKIKGTHLMHPKYHMGVNTINGSLRNPTHDIRGDIANPKVPVSPWGNSTIEPDTNLRGVCYPI